MKQNAHGSWYPGRKHPERCRVQRALRGLMAQLIVGITVVTAASARGEEPDVMWFWCEHVWCLGSMLTRAEAEAARTEKVQSSYSRPILWMKRPKGVPCRKSPLDAKGCVIEARTAPAPVAIMRPEDIWLLLTEDQKALSAKGKSITLSRSRRFTCMGHSHASPNRFRLATQSLRSRPNRRAFARLDSTLSDPESVHLECQLPSARRLQVGACRIHRSDLSLGWRLHAIARNSANV